MLEIKMTMSDKIKLPCMHCLHNPVCSLVGSAESIRVTIPDDHFKAVIECTEFIPILDDSDDSSASVKWNESNDNEEQA